MIRVACSSPGCGFTATARDGYDAQDVLVSHHNVEHGRPHQGTWPAYNPPERETRTLWNADGTPVMALEAYAAEPEGPLP